MVYLWNSQVVRGFPIQTSIASGNFPSHLWWRVTKWDPPSHQSFSWRSKRDEELHLLQGFSIAPLTYIINIRTVLMNIFIEVFPVKTPLTEGFFPFPSTIRRCSQKAPLCGPWQEGCPVRKSRSMPSLLWRCDAPMMSGQWTYSWRRSNHQSMGIVVRLASHVSLP